MEGIGRTLKGYVHMSLFVQGKFHGSSEKDVDVLIDYLAVSVAVEEIPSGAKRRFCSGFS